MGVTSARLSFNLRELQLPTTDACLRVHPLNSSPQALTSPFYFYAVQPSPLLQGGMMAGEASLHASASLSARTRATSLIRSP